MRTGTLFKIIWAFMVILGALYVVAGVTNNRAMMDRLNTKATRNGWSGKLWYRIYSIVIGLIFIGFGVTELF